MPNKKYILKTNAESGKPFDIKYEEELNKEQYEVVTSGDGPCLVLAGAGSGKTRTLVYRVLYLLDQGIKPQNIMLVTFTNKAAKEMLERVAVLLGQDAKGLWGGTFHHLGNRLLRIYGRQIGIENNFTILDEEDSQTLLKNCLSRVNSPRDKYFPKAKVIANIISLSTNLSYPLKEIVKERFAYLKPEYLSYIEEAAKLYQTRKQEANSLDFDDLLLKWNELLTKAPEVREKLGQQFKYILVDEYQDTNFLQNQIIVNLAQPQKNVLVVGDDAQSIYSFRGADVNNILNFPKIFPEAKIFRLQINYRSTPEILALANDSINQNTNKFEKHLAAVKPKAQKPAVAGLTDLYQQAEFICQRILELQKDDGVALNDIAVLFRSHFQSLELEMEFNKRNIPYQMRGGMRFFEQAHLKDVLAYLKILNNLNDEISWLRILSMQAGIGEATADKIWQTIIRMSTLADILVYDFRSLLGVRAYEGWKNLKRILDKLVPIDINDISAAIEIIISRGYEEYLKANYENFNDRLEDLNQLVNFARSYEGLEKFLSDTTLAENFRGQSRGGQEEGESEAVILSTIHQAKGLEWKIVFVIGLADGQFPHSRVWDKPQEIEEERRLFYVATTRAKDQLYLTYPIFGAGDVIYRPSQFITELSGNLYDRWDVDEMENEEVIYVDEDEGGPPPKKRKILDFKL
ncbi:MAG: ATP-dependent helicase [Patescibacteria group bacterium]